MTSFASAAATASANDPYKILNVPRSATQDQIRRAYKKACLRHHPDKHPAGAARVEAERIFKLIVYSYSQLTDSGTAPATRTATAMNRPSTTTTSPPTSSPNNRRAASQAHTNGPSSTPLRQTNTHQQQQQQTPRRAQTPPKNPSSSPKANGAAATPPRNNNPSSRTPEPASTTEFDHDPQDGADQDLDHDTTYSNPNSFQRSQFANFFAGGLDTGFESESFKLPDREVDLPLSLEELNGGCMKRRKLRVAGFSDNALPVLTIHIKPGYRPGDRVRFRRAWTPPGSPLPVDVVFVISQRAHSIFTLDGDDLRLTMRLNLVDALTGALLVVKTIDNTPLNLLLEPVISPKHTEVVNGHGMPRRADPSQRGDLLVSFDIVFPTAIDADFRPTLRDLFHKFEGGEREKEKDRDSNKDSAMSTSSKSGGTKRSIRRSSSVFVNTKSNPTSASHVHVNGSNLHTYQQHRQPNSFHLHQPPHHHQQQSPTSTTSTTQQSSSKQPQPTTASSIAEGGRKPPVHSPTNSQRRASATQDLDSSRACDRRDDSASQRSQRPHSKSRRRFANIFR